MVFDRFQGYDWIYYLKLFSVKFLVREIKLNHINFWIIIKLIDSNMKSDLDFIILIYSFQTWIDSFGLKSKEKNKTRYKLISKQKSILSLQPYHLSNIYPNFFSNNVTKMTGKFQSQWSAWTQGHLITLL